MSLFFYLYIYSSENYAFTCHLIRHFTDVYSTLTFVSFFPYGIQQLFCCCEKSVDGFHPKFVVTWKPNAPRVPVKSINLIEQKSFRYILFNMTITNCVVREKTLLPKRTWSIGSTIRFLFYFI